MFYMSEQELKQQKEQQLWEQHELINQIKELVKLYQNNEQLGLVIRKLIDK